MATKIQREPMTHVDAAWLQMDSSVNLMVINAVMLIEDVIDFDRLLQIFTERFVEPYPRFTQCIVESPPGTGRLFWEDYPHFDIRSHIHRIALPSPADTATLQYLIGNLMSEPLDRYRPLWRFYLIENVDGGCALYGRIHHCIADGIALIRVLLSLTDPEIDLEREETETPVVPGNPETNGNNFSMLPASFAFASSVLGSTLHSVTEMAGSLMHNGLHKVEHPGELISLAKSAGILSAASAAILAKLLVMPADRQSAYRTTLNSVKRITWSEPIGLEDVKQIGRATGATINDVLVATVTGALRRDLQQRDKSAGNDAIHAMVPVNLRPLESDIHMGNEFSLVYLGLPVHMKDPLERLYEVKRKMDRLKSSPEALIVYQVLNLLGMLPGELAHQATEWFAGKATCVLTNVPGPRQPLHLADKKIRQIMFWVPQSGDIGMGISIISYNGSVIIGVMVDEGLVKNPEQITQNIHKEFNELRSIANSLAATIDMGS